MRESVVSYALSRLNQRNNGKAMFEQLCQNLITKYIDPSFLRSSGGDAGGDGAIDGRDITQSKHWIKYAFSIDKDFRRKIDSEVSSIREDRYVEMRFFSNQPIRQKEKEDLTSKYSTLKLAIYDHEDLTTLIMEHPDLGVFIDFQEIQNSISIDYLKEHNQLRDKSHEIVTYIPRRVKSWDEEEKRFLSIELNDYLANLPSVSIIRGPAGYGKTGLLQQIHQQTINSTCSNRIPPVYVQLSSYTPSNLLSMVKQGMQENGDYICGDFLMLLDGLDEVKESSRDSLHREITALISHQSCTRKVIVSVRENTYSPTAFESMFETKVLTLEGLDKESILQLFAIMSLPDMAGNLLLSSSFFNGFSDNIFYVCKFVEYFQARAFVASSVPDLFEYICEQELTRIFRRKCPIDRGSEHIALYMTINQLPDISDTAAATRMGFELPMQPFTFSHRSIQEYLAARLISRQPLDEIKALLFNGRTIVPYLDNTLGFVLNILNGATEGLEKFEALVSWAVGTEGNARRLLKIEADRISPEMNAQIFRAVVEQEAKTGSAFDIPESLMAFGMRRDSSNPNLDFLVARIMESKNLTYYQYYTLLLQQIVYKHPEALSEEHRRRIVEYFFALLDESPGLQSISVIKSLLYCICQPPFVQELPAARIDELVAKLLLLADHESVIENTCEMLLHRGEVLSSTNYFAILDSILHRISAEAGQIAHIVPTQTEDDQYNAPLHITSWFAFLPLTVKFLSADQNYLWDLLDQLPSKLGNSEHWSFSSEQVEKLLGAIEKEVIEQLQSRVPTAKEIELISTWVATSISRYRESPLLFSLCGSMDIGVAKEVSKRLLASCERLAFGAVVSLYLENVVVTMDDFDSFAKEFHESSVAVFREFFVLFCYRLDETSPIYSYMLSKLPTELANQIVSSKNTNARILARQSERVQDIRESCYIALDKATLVREVSDFFKKIGSDSVLKEEYWKFVTEFHLSGSRTFARFLFEDALSQASGRLTADWLSRFLEEAYLHDAIPEFFVRFCSENGLGFDFLNFNARTWLVEWAKRVLDRFPLDNPQKEFRGVHLLLGHLVRTSSFLKDDSDFLRSYASKLIGFSLSGFLRGLSGAYSLNYESVSLEYLNAYIPVGQLLSFICDNLSVATSNQRTLLSVCGYILAHEDELLPFQAQKVLGTLTGYLQSELSRPVSREIISCARSLGFRVTDIDYRNLGAALLVDDKLKDLTPNLASTLIEDFEHTALEVEMAHLLRALKWAFSRSRKKFHKKTFAEYYIRKNSSAGRIFKYYARYLLSSQSHPILQKFGDRFSGVLKTSEIGHLMIVNRLFRYSIKKGTPSDRRSSITHIAISSYQAIASRAANRTQLNRVFRSMRSVAKGDGDFLRRYIRDLETAFIDSNRSPITIEQIMRL